MCKERYSVEAHLGFLVVESPTAGHHYLTQALEVLGVIVHRPFLFLINKLLDALVHDAFGE